MLEIKHKDDGKKGEFYIGDNGQRLAEIAYTWAGEKVFIIEHTDVDETLRGQGVGNKLLERAVAMAREKISKSFRSALLQNRFLIKIHLFTMC